MTMTTAELIDRLQSADPDGDKEVRMAYQESWPLQSTVRGAVAGSDVGEEEEDDEERDQRESYLDGVVFIVEGGQVYDTPYAPRGCFEAAY